MKGLPQVRMNEADLRPVSALFETGRYLYPARSCRTVMRKPGVWFWKKLYVSEADARVSADRDALDAYECWNCGFWHVGRLRRPK